MPTAATTISRGPDQKVEYLASSTPISVCCSGQAGLQKPRQLRFQHSNNNPPPTAPPVSPLSSTLLRSYTSSCAEQSHPSDKKKDQVAHARPLANLCLGRHCSSFHSLSFPRSAQFLHSLAVKSFCQAHNQVSLRSTLHHGRGATSD